MPMRLKSSGTPRAVAVPALRLSALRLSALGLSAKVRANSGRLSASEESMRILDLGEFYSERGGGVRSYLGALLEASAARGHEVIVLVPGPKDSDERVPGGRIVRYRAPPMPYDNTYHLPARVDLMRRHVREFAPDVLQLSSPYLPWLALRGVPGPALARRALEKLGLEVRGLEAKLRS